MAGEAAAAKLVALALQLEWQNEATAGTQRSVPAKSGAGPLVCSFGRRMFPCTCCLAKVATWFYTVPGCTNLRESHNLARLPCAISMERGIPSQLRAVLHVHTGNQQYQRGFKKGGQGRRKIFERNAPERGIN